MKKDNTTKRFSWIITAFIFTALASITFSCETAEEDGICEEVEEICVEVVTICSSTTEEYYISNGDTIYCAAIDDCTTAEDSVFSSCELATETKKAEVTSILRSIMNDIRLMNN